MERAAGKVLQDVLDGYITNALAQDIYGVVIVDGAVDSAATETARGALKSSAPEPDLFNFGDARDAYMRRFPSLVLDELYDLLQELPLHLRYRAKQLSMRLLEEQFGDGSATPGWLNENWLLIERELYGLNS